MKVVIAMDSFKGSLSSMEAGNAVREGLLRVFPGAAAVIKPLADGGEGTVEALVTGMGGVMESVTVTGPLGVPVECRYGMIEKGDAASEDGVSVKTAVIEMAGAAGLVLAPPEKRNPLFTTTYGVGEVIRDGIQKGCRRFLVGIGGSATNDGGVGMLQALGYDFVDEEENQIPFGAQGLKKLCKITDDHVLPELRECEFRIACDVENPLCGQSGCSAVYGPQKGADEDMVCRMDEWIAHYASLAKKKCPKADPWQKGAGAAGGLGFAFVTFTNADLESGIQIVLRETGLAQEISDADLVITGEGRLDGQSAMGKAPVGVARLAKSYGKTVFALAGSVTREARGCNAQGIDAFFPAVRGITTLSEAMEKENAWANLADTAEQVFRCYMAGLNGSLRL